MVESVASKRVLDPHPAATAGAGIIGVVLVFFHYSIFCLPNHINISSLTTVIYHKLSI
jgi:hypothetical protein